MKLQFILGNSKKITGPSLTTNKFGHSESDIRKESKKIGHSVLKYCKYVKEFKIVDDTLTD